MNLQTNRRTFLVSSAALLVANSLPKICAGQSEAVRGDELFTNATLGAYASNQMTLAAFEAVKGSLFMLMMPDGRSNYMTLKSVQAYKQAPRTVLVGKAAIASIQSAESAPVSESFTVTFSKDDTVIPQGSYVLDHGRLGRFTVFLVPGPGTPGRMTMVATFNYLKAPAAVKTIPPVRQLLEL